MFSATELTKLGEQIAQDYLEHGTPLNEGLEKVASNKGLNSNQIDRVAEAANVKTHLRMLKTAEDNYIQFDIADPKAVKPKEEIKTAQDNYDYSEAPKTTHKYDDVSPFELAGEKLAEEGKPDDALEKYNRSVEKQAEVNKLQNCLVESSIRLQTLASPIYSLCKQAALGGTDIEDLQYVIKEASDKVGSYVINEILEPNLEKDGIDFSEKDLEKTASRNVNPENELYQAVQEYHNEAAFAYHVNEVYQEKVGSLGSSLIEKRAKSGAKFIGDNVKGLLKFIKKHPVISGGTGMYLVGKGVGRHREQIENMPLATQKRIRSGLKKSQVY